MSLNLPGANGSRTASSHRRTARLSRSRPATPLAAPPALSNLPPRPTGPQEFAARLRETPASRAFKHDANHAHHGRASSVHRSHTSQHSLELADGQDKSG